MFLVNGETRVLEANRPETWQHPIMLGVEGKGESRWVRLAMRWLSRKPQVLMPAMSRGDEVELPVAERVVAWSEKGIDLEALLTPAAKGPMRLGFEPLSSEGLPIADNPARISTVFDLDPSSPDKPRAPLAEGLYRVTVLDGLGIRTGLDAWLLVCGAEGFTTANASFEESRTMAKDLAVVDPRSARGFLRGILLTLSNNPSTFSRSE